MPSLLSRYQHDVAAASPSLILPLALLLFSLLVYPCTASKHSLLTGAVAWLSIWLICTVVARGKLSLAATPSQRLAWTAGLLFSLAHVCDRAVDARTIWWAKVIHSTLDLGT